MHIQWTLFPNLEAYNDPKPVDMPFELSNQIRISQQSTIL